MRKKKTGKTPSPKHKKANGKLAKCLELMS